ncbi:MULTISPECIES: AbrB/MazE/SpoVT family DNA-binding domain-containing protein [unclassified Halomonas]|uniref:AbrB/MazE/SpoVT family DNA-binding domain-containing protein n=1 Tax=unclassified Halomonas TaxID=2609666 RepID=UPI0005FA22AB|nr:MULTISPECIES: AbrB/MazE/SpoVT family DNA-binding domain-containing protein [unclassified Halomonas]KJZ16989.1 PbsX family transcriptional regulator [Halomonas sp. S2151]MAR74235.1 AbrB/MazE/SpoVT family DNA-binding domain-containing protein [Halomonas sp.]MCO7216955.1 AbrB/MazE/SpoVT family DNA-binding domain-containing protein [Halomonas sp. OfavH-34-E]|tara:strand:- start:400 stop:654 length:255 start_codon:yes stop_codon:yes gene_type:complete
MELKIQKWGNSAAIRLPVELLRQLGLSDGDLLEVEETSHRLVLKPVASKPKYSLEELLARCDPEAPEPEDLASWQEMAPVGREE